MPCKALVIFLCSVSFLESLAKRIAKFEIMAIVESCHPKRMILNQRIRHIAETCYYMTLCFCVTLQFYYFIQLFYNSLTKSGLAPKTVKNIHGVLHTALEQAISNGYIHKNPTAGCKLPKVVRPEIKPLEPEEIARMLKEAKKDAYDNLFIVAMFTGMRQGELLGLSWDNVNFKAGQITIKQQLQCKDGVYFLETPKSGKCRVLSPAPVVMEALKDEQQQQNANKQIVGAAWENKFNLVFTDALGKNLVRRTVVKHFKTVIERANIPPDVRFHDLRHSFAVTSLYSGDDVKTVQANLGHATAQFTLDVYGHVTQKMRQESAMRMQAFYNHLEV